MSLCKYVLLHPLTFLQKQEFGPTYLREPMFVKALSGMYSRFQRKEIIDVHLIPKS